MKINANPTKSFFITMLTRDISLDRAILDLIDNSVDAANTQQSFEHLKVEIRIGEDMFEIQDNCGGISEDIAVNYAFRFGRDPDDHRETPSSVGQFGVGMKRTLFKLGEGFRVESSFKNANENYEEFAIDVDVEDWLGDKGGDWGFELSRENTSIKDGTKITVNKLHESVKEQFLINEFLVSLKKEIAEAHFKAIKKGLLITLNNEAISASEIKLNISDEIKPIFIQ
ncbi:MAG: ATP-binding protein, partial [Paraglaciecola sp.]|nr:ATP-binding protein [Paraglaciecola sp.]